MKEFLQEFQRVVRNSEYERRVLVDEFKRELNRIIRKKLIEIERPLTSIE